MCEIQGLSDEPAVAYQQGRRDGRAETLHAVELATTDSQQLKAEICHCEHNEYWLRSQESNGWLDIDFCPNCGKHTAI